MTAGVGLGVCTPSGMTVGFGVCTGVAAGCVAAGGVSVIAGASVGCAVGCGTWVMTGAIVGTGCWVITGCRSAGGGVQAVSVKGRCVMQGAGWRLGQPESPNCEAGDPADALPALSIITRIRDSVFCFFSIGNLHVFRLFALLQ